MDRVIKYAKCRECRQKFPVYKLFKGFCSFNCARDYNEGKIKKKAKKPINKKPKLRVLYQGVLMPEHTKIYLEGMKYDVTDTVYCEVTGEVAVDTHHILPRRIGGRKRTDRIEELMALTRAAHEKYGDKKEHYKFLITTHFKKLDERGVEYDNKYFEQFGIFINQ